MRDVNTITQNYKSIGLQLQGDTTSQTQCFKLKAFSEFSLLKTTQFKVSTSIAAVSQSEM